MDAAQCTVLVDLCTDAPGLSHQILKIDLRGHAFVHAGGHGYQRRIAIVRAEDGLTTVGHQTPDKKHMRTHASEHKAAPVDEEDHALAFVGRDWPGTK